MKTGLHFLPVADILTEREIEGRMRRAPVFGSLSELSGLLSDGFLLRRSGGSRLPFAPFGLTPEGFKRQGAAARRFLPLFFFAEIRLITQPEG